MKKRNLFLLLLISIIGIGGAFATKQKPKVKITGYTEYFGVTTDGTVDHYTWTTTRPPASDNLSCETTFNNSSCDVLVSDSYTPQDNTPIPLQYRGCPTCTQLSNLLMTP